MVLIPERGGRDEKVSPFVLTHSYWAEVFRWHQFRMILPWWKGSQNGKVEAARKACDVDGLCWRIRLMRGRDPNSDDLITVDDLLAFNGLRPGGELTKVQPQGPERVGEIVVAKMYDVTVPHVANVVSNYPRFALRQVEFSLK
jgi:hypothetical protein